MYKPDPLGRWLGRLLSLALLALLPQLSWAQTTRTLPGDYATFVAAFTDLNANGVPAGGLTINVAAGYVEANNTVLPVLTATGTAASPLVFQKSGTGANPIIAAGTGTGTGATSTDGIIRLSGSDYVTFNGIDLTERLNNVTTTTQMEYGYALFRASATDGCQHVTIRNSTVTLDRINTATVAIWSAPSTAAAPNTGLAATSADGANSFNKVYGNTVSAYQGIFFQGPSATNSDTGNEIGTTAGNNVTGLGTGSSSSTVHGLRGEYQKDFKVENNTVTVPAGYTGSGTLQAISIGSSATTGITGTLLINNNTISLESASTGTVYGIRQAATSALTSVSITNNTVQNSVLSAASNTINYIVNDASAGTIVMSGNTVRNNSTVSTGVVSAIYHTAGSGTVTMANNVITGNRNTGAGGTFYGLRITSGAYTVNGNTVTDNAFSSTSSTTAANLYGYYSNSSATLENIYDNTFADLRIVGASTSTSHIVVGIRTWPAATANKEIYQNTISGLSIGVTGTGSGAAHGIFTSGGATTNIFRNKIYDLSASNAGGTVNGLNLGSGTTVTAHNNLVGDLRAPAATSLLAVSGVLIAGGTNINLYYNTVYLQGTSSGATFGTSGIYLSSTSPTLNARNNVVVNTSVAKGTGGYAAAFRRVSGTAGTVPANYATTSNNNLFYAGTPSATSLIYVEGTTTATNPQQTLAAYKTFMGNRDQLSVTENPPFLSTDGASPEFLHINPNVGTQIESSGAPIAGITLDFDQETRDASTPDIGADEGSFTGVDLTAPLIAYTPLTNTVVTPSRNLVVTITDASGVELGGGAPRIYYRKGSSGAYTSAAASSTSGNSYTFTINYAALGGVAPGDVIQYYVAAQDVNGNAGTSPSGGSGANPPGSTAPATPNQYTLLPTLAGNYYVGVSAHTPPATYATLTDAAAAYNSGGLGGAVNFILIDATYPAITTPITFNQNLDASTTNRLTIKPEAGVQPTLTGNSSGGILVLNGADYVTLDGSNTANGTTRDWTISNTGGSAVLVKSLGLNAGATDNVVKNLNLLATSTTSGYGLAVGGSTAGSNGADNDNLTIQNNNVVRASVGIYVGGTTTTSAGGTDGLLISGNVVGPVTSGTDNIGGSGIQLTNALAPTLTGNTVQNLSGSATLTGLNLSSGVVGATISQNTVRNFTSSGSSTTNPVTGISLGLAVGAPTTVSQNTVQNIGGSPVAYGVRVGPSAAAADVTISQNLIENITSTGNNSYGLSIGSTSTATDVTNVVVDRNRILGISASSTSGYGGKGIEVSVTSQTSNIRLSNNFVQVTAASGWTALTSDANVGIRLLNGGGVSLYYNSVNLTGTYNRSGADLSAALYVYASATNLDVRNNIFANGIVSTGGAAKAYALYSAAANTAFSQINHNDYYVSGTQGVLGYLGGDLTSLANLSSATGQDAASISANPIFAADNDLHASGLALNAAATPIAGITLDIDGATRNASTPDIGADEFTPAAVDLGAIALLNPPATGCYSATQQVSVRIQNLGAATINFAVNPATITGSVSGAATQTFTPVVINTGTLAPGETRDVVLGTVNMIAAGTYTFNAAAGATGETNTTNNDIAPVTRTQAGVAALPQQLDFTGLTGTNLGTLYPGWSEATGVTPTGTTSNWVSDSFGNVTSGPNGTSAAINLDGVNETAWMLSPRFVATATTEVSFDLALTTFGATTADVLDSDDLFEVRISTDCGLTYTPLRTFNSGTTISNTGQSVVISLPATYANQEVIVGFFATEGATVTGDIDLFVDNIRIRNLYATNLRATALFAPAAAQSCYSPAEAVTVTVKNEGTAALNFAVNPATVTAVVTTPGGPVTLSAQLNSGTLAADATQNVTLTSGTLDMSAAGTYTFDLTATVTGDQYPADDNLAVDPVRTVTAPVAGTIAPVSTSFCQGNTVTLTVTGAANGTIQWQSSTDNLTFTDISGANAATYTSAPLTQTTYFRAVTRCNSAEPASNVATVTVTNPQITATNSPQTICEGNPVTLTATAAAGNTIRWYDTNSSTTVLATGPSFTTPVQSASRQYFVSATATANATVGRPAPTSTTNAAPSNYGLVFNAASAFTLESVDVYPTGSAGNLVIRVTNSAGTLIPGLETTVEVPAGTGTTAFAIPLNFEIPAGTGMRLLAVSGPSLVRETSGVTTPYSTPGGEISITSGYISGTSTTYYYFYNWQVETECTGSRTPVQVDVTPATAITVTPSATSVCAGESVNVTVTPDAPVYTSYTYSPMTGVVLNQPDGSAATITPTATTTYTVTASDGVPGGCSAVRTFTLTVKPLPTPTPTATAATICLGGSSQLNANAIGANLSFTNSTSGAIPDNNPTGVSRAVTVAGVPGTALTTGTIKSVTVNITHGFAEDLDISLIGPDGTTTIDLSSDNGSGDDNYTNTVFSPTATASITTGTAPFTGSFLPEQSFDAFNGLNPNGTWTLKVADDDGAFTGTLTNWTIAFESGLTYTWTGPGLSATNVANPTATPLTAGTATYSVTVNSPNGCSATASTSVTVNARPTATVTASPTAVTPGQASTISVALTGTGPWTFTYTNGTTPVTVTNTSTNPYTFSTGNLSSPTTYTVTALSDANCTATPDDLEAATATVTILAPPVDVRALALVSPVTGTSCVSGLQTVTVRVENAGTEPLDFSTDPVTVTVNVTGAATQTYSTVINSGANLAAGATLDVNLTTTLDMSTPGTYNFAVSVTTPNDTNNGNDTRTETHVVPTAPVLAVAAPTEACLGSSFTVTTTPSAGTYSGSAAPALAIPDNNTTGIASTITLSGAPAGSVISSSSVIKVTLNIPHEYAGDVDVYLVGPGNTGTLELTTDNGGSSENYTNTVLSTAATTNITSGSAPFTGTYRTEGLTNAAPSVGSYSIPAAALNGAAINGAWTLRVFDDGSGDTGTLANWSLEISQPLANSTTTLTGPAGATITGPVASGNSSVFTVTNVPVGAAAFTATTTTNDTNCSTSNAFSVNVTETTTWTGATSTTWATATNWSACAPTSAISVVVPTGLTRYPSLTTGTPAVRNITFDGTGTMTMSAGTLSVHGNWTRTGTGATSTFTGGTVSFVGTGEQVITNPGTFYNLTVNKPGGDTLRLGANTNVANTLTLTNGILKTYSGAATYAVNLSGTSSSLVESASSFVLGNVSKTATPTGGVAQTFGGIGVTLTARTTGGAVLPGATTVTRMTGKPVYGTGANSSNASIRRQYVIAPTNDANLNVDLVFRYSDAPYELNGLPEANLTLFSAATTAGPWRPEGGTRNATANTVTRTGLNHLSVWTLGNFAAPLPVALTSFEAKRDGADALLTWTTAQERNSQGFEVQVSTDGRSYRTLGFVASATPNSDGPRAYRFADREAGKLGTRYYRLRQLDLDGTEALYGPRQLTFEASAQLGLAAYPTLFGTQLTVEVSSPAAGATEVQLLDAVGRVILRQPATLVEGLQKLPLNGVDQLPTGTYVLRLTAAGQTRTVRVVKQ